MIPKFKQFTKHGQQGGDYCSPIKKKNTFFFTPLVAYLNFFTGHPATSVHSGFSAHWWLYPKISGVDGGFYINGFFYWGGLRTPKHPYLAANSSAVYIDLSSAKKKDSNDIIKATFNTCICILFSISWLKK